ncbi:uncharacterized protein METZ01_LOCUS318740, partial [marine metagenome]
MINNVVCHDRKQMFAIVAYCLFTLLSSSPLSAQTGALSGHVIDAETSEPVPWATVVVEGFDHHRISDQLGYFFF